MKGEALSTKKEYPTWSEKEKEVGLKALARIYAGWVSVKLSIARDSMRRSLVSRTSKTS